MVLLSLSASGASKKINSFSPATRTRSTKNNLRTPEDGGFTKKEEHQVPSSSPSSRRVQEGQQPLVSKEKIMASPTTKTIASCEEQCDGGGGDSSCGDESESDSSSHSRSSSESSDSSSHSSSSSSSASSSTSTTTADSDRCHSDDDEDDNAATEATTTTTTTKKKSKTCAVKSKKTTACCLTAGKCIRSCVAYGRVCPLLADAAGQAAALKLETLFEDSVLFKDCRKTTATKSCKNQMKGKKRSDLRDPAEKSENSECSNNSSNSSCSSWSSVHDYDYRDEKNEFSCFPNVAIIQSSDIVMGEKLGEGGFCNVYSCALKKRDKKVIPQACGEGARTTTTAAAAHNLDLTLISTDESCAVKFLRREITAHRKNFQHGAADLAAEAFFLARLGDDNGKQHPNIVQLKAVAAGSVEENIRKMAQGSVVDENGFKDDSDDSPAVPNGFFIVIERLVETLEQRIKRWQARSEADQNAHSHSLFYRLSKDYKDKQREWLKERIQVAADIANVMAYLSSRGVAFRDLKPDNIGFDRYGTLKLFDLGLCKEEKPSLVLANYKNDSRLFREDGCSSEKNTTSYRMTGHTGSRRYMAPEVALDQGYNKSVDVYSFGILLWEILSLEKPFKCYGSKKHLALVIEGGERPKIDTHLPVNLQWLMKSCWSTCPQDRPSFDAARSTLLDVLEDLSSSTTPVRTRSHSTGSHNDAGGSPMRRPPQSDKAKTLSPVFEAIKIPAGLGGLRVRSLGLKRGHS